MFNPETCANKLMCYSQIPMLTPIVPEAILMKREKLQMRQPGEMEGPMKTEVLETILSKLHMICYSKRLLFKFFMVLLHNFIFFH